MAELISTNIYGKLTVTDDVLITGNIGIGTNTPTAKLDVDGQIRIRGGGTPATGCVLTAIDGDGNACWCSPSIDGSGTANTVARWTTSNTLGTGSICDSGNDCIAVGHNIIDGHRIFACQQCCCSTIFGCNGFQSTDGVAAVGGQSGPSVGAGYLSYVWTNNCCRAGVYGSIGTDTNGYGVYSSGNLGVCGNVKFEGGANRSIEFISDNTTTLTSNKIEILGQNASRGSLNVNAGEITIKAGNVLSSAGGSTVGNYNGGNLLLYGGDSNTGTGIGSKIAGGSVCISGGKSCSSSSCNKCGGDVYICGGDAKSLSTSGERLGGNITIRGGGTAGTSVGNQCGGSVSIAGGLGFTSTSCGEIMLCVGNSLRLKGCSDSTYATVLYQGIVSNPRLCTLSNGVCVVGTGFATDWVASSDCRLKTNIKPINNALSMVTQLCGVCYNECNDEKHENKVGLIAQEVLSIIPEIVSQNEPKKDDILQGIEDVKYGIKYDKLTAVLVEAIKEQQKQIEELKNQIK